MPDFSAVPATIGEYRALRGLCGLTVFTEAAVAIGLANTLHGVWLREEGRLVGMGRLIGDGGCFALVCDIAVDPDFRRQGWGGAIVTRLMAWGDAHLPEKCFVSLIADPGAEPLYERAGFDYYTGMARFTSPH
ncbi:MAG: GNAT family N-acetyltransferase [Pseudomonadota bacterium]